MKKYKNEVIIVFINLFIVSLFCFTNIFGATMDFLTQHIVFPQYLRELFYFNGRVIPSFMIHLGAGQNIFNIAYYGLLNPVILFSYFFPFVKMIDYIVAVNVILLVASNLLFYRFLKCSFSCKLSLFLTLLFCFSGPIIFQFHRHFMFVNYMPFLILGLINIKNCRWNRFIIDVFLIIMISFYFSVPSIICLIVYYIYINFDGFSFRNFVKFLSYIFISILMCSILLMPTIYSILSSRAGDGTFSLLMLLPSFNLSNILYGAYSTGLSSILIVSFLYLFCSKKNNLFLGIVFSVLFFLPIFMFVLNGGLYVRGKCFIPFIPLLVYIVGLFFRDIDKVNTKFLIFLVLGFNLIVLFYYHNYLYYIDLLFIILLIAFYNKYKNKYIFGLILILDFILCINLNLSEDYIPNNYDFSFNFKSNDNYRVSNLDNNFVNVNGGNYISSFYSSTGNKYYNNLYHNIFRVNNSSINNLSINSSSNVLFNEFIGNKYVLGNDLFYPYKEVSDGVYELEQVLPIGYVNHNTVNRDYFYSLGYPYNLDLLLNYIITSDSDNYPSSNVEEVHLNYSYELGDNIDVLGDKLYVSSDSRISVFIEDDLSNKILFISMDNQVEQDNDISISINGQKNILTKSSWLYPNHNNIFNFCISGSNRLDILVSRGVYNIGSIRTYVLDNIYIQNISVDEFNISVMNSEVIKGNINVTRDGYFVLKVPYDKGFKIKVNGDIIDYELVDEAFIGFYLNKGFYDIEITYIPPYLREGCVLSIIGFCLFFISLFKRRKV